MPVVKYEGENSDILIDEDKCTACGTCVDVCPSDVYEVGDVSKVVDVDECLVCMACVDSCPEEAIKVIEK